MAEVQEFFTELSNVDILASQIYLLASNNNFWPDDKTKKHFEKQFGEEEVPLVDPVYLLGRLKLSSEQPDNLSVMDRLSDVDTISWKNLNTVRLELSQLNKLRKMTTFILESLDPNERLSERDELIIRTLAEISNRQLIREGSICPFAGYLTEELIKKRPEYIDPNIINVFQKAEEQQSDEEIIDAQSTAKALVRRMKETGATDNQILEFITELNRRYFKNATIGCAGEIVAAGACLESSQDILWGNAHPGGEVIQSILAVTGCLLSRKAFIKYLAGMRVMREIGKILGE